MTFGASYDQMGGAFRNQTDLTIGIPLPLWNKNKGNIKTAQALVSQAEIEKKSLQLEISSEVKSGVFKIFRTKIQL